MGNAVTYILRTLLPAESTIITRICRLGGLHLVGLPSPAVRDDNTVEGGDGVEVPGVVMEVGSGGSDGVSAATGRFTVILVPDSLSPADTCNKLLATTKVTPLKINIETQTSTVISENLWQKHKARILFYMSCVCFTAATISLVQFVIKSIVSII